MLLTTGQAADEIGCAVTTFRRLLHAGLLPRQERRGVRTVVPVDTVTALRDRHRAPLSSLSAPVVAVLRVDVAKPVDEPDRAWTGFSTALAPEDLLKALRGWWRCDAASVAAGGVLPVTLSGYVVAVLTNIATWEKNEHGRHAFPQAQLAGYVTDLARPTVEVTASARTDRALAERLLGTRLPSDSGGAVAYVTTNATTG